MNAAAILAALNALIEGAERLGPVIADLRRQGLITVEEQAAVKARLDAVRAETFSGPEWDVTP